MEVLSTVTGPCVCPGGAESEQSIPIMLTQQELAALIQQQQQLQDLPCQAEDEAEPGPVPTGTRPPSCARHKPHSHAHDKRTSSLCFPEGLAPADSLNDPAAESNGLEVTSSAVSSALARLASTFGPAPPVPASSKTEPAAPVGNVSNGITANEVVRRLTTQHT